MNATVSLPLVVFVTFIATIPMVIPWSLSPLPWFYRGYHDLPMSLSPYSSLSGTSVIGLWRGLKDDKRAHRRQLINPLECKGNYSATSHNM